MRPAPRHGLYWETGGTQLRTRQNPTQIPTQSLNFPIFQGCVCYTVPLHQLFMGLPLNASAKVCYQHWLLIRAGRELLPQNVFGWWLPMPQIWRFLQNRAISRKGLISLLKSKCVLRWRAGGEERDANLSNGVDWIHTFLIAMIQKGGNFLYHEGSCRRAELLLAQIQHLPKAEGNTGITLGLLQHFPLMGPNPRGTRCILWWRCLLHVRHLRGSWAARRASSPLPAHAPAGLPGFLPLALPASLPPASAGTLCHPASVTAVLSIMHEPSFFTILNQIKIRCFLGTAVHSPMGLPQQFGLCWVLHVKFRCTFRSRCCDSREQPPN